MTNSDQDGGRTAADERADVVAFLAIRVDTLENEAERDPRSHAPSRAAEAASLMRQFEQCAHVGAAKKEG